jgi:hypothetical protein
MILYPRRSWRGQCHGSIPAWPRHKRRGYRIVTVVLAKHKKWLPDDGSYVNRNMSERPSEFLIVLIFLWFYDCVHHCGTIKVLWLPAIFTFGICWNVTSVARVVILTMTEILRKSFRMKHLKFHKLKFEVHEIIFLLGLTLVSELRKKLLAPY